MHDVMKLVARRKAELGKHPFFKWITSSTRLPEERLTFAPIMANFVMNFRDMNLWFIRFAHAPTRFETIINGNTREDETHSSLFIEDWRKLRLDERLGWSSSDVIWWLFLAKETEPFRSYAFDFASLTVRDQGDPLLRFAHSESGEACGNCFFSVLAPFAAGVAQATGQDYRYFGTYHLNRERGHVIASEGVFERETLAPERRQLAMRLANDMFDIFFDMHDHFFEYATNYVEQDRVPIRERTPPPPLVPMPAEPERSSPPAVAPVHQELQDHLDARRKQAAAHPFYAWLLGDHAASARDRLRSFIPMWVMDIMGYRDLNRYAFKFRSPRNERERSFNQWVEALETHSELFMRDWDALDMDDVLGWSASESMEFLFLDPGMDVHRRNMAAFIRMALAHPEPILRFWMLEALEASGEAFFATSKVLARRAELETGIRLDYLADRHYLAHPQAPGRCVYPFRSEAITAEQRDVAHHLINVVFDALAEQLTLSLEVARSNRFGVVEGGRVPASPGAPVLPASRALVKPPSVAPDACLLSTTM